MKKYSISLLLGALLWACQPQASQQADEEANNTDLPASTPVKPAFASANQLDETLKAYLAVKDNFVKSDTTGINQSVAELQAKLNAVDSSTLAAGGQAKWNEMKAMLMRTTDTLKTVSKLEEKRQSFEDLSKLMYELVTTFGATETVYKQYCPMALNDKGAYWLSVNSEIRNPYFGDKMLECGEVEQVLTFEK